MPETMKFPTEANVVNEVKRGFYNKWRMPGIIGAIDGTHMEIIAPPMTDAHNRPFIFVNRKGRFSVNVMLISDSNCKILAANALYPGSVHDSAIWNMSTKRSLAEPI